MKVEFTGLLNGSSVTRVLSPGGRNGTFDLEINTRRIIEEVSLPRASGIKLFDRANEQNRITFGVRAFFSSAKGAEAQALVYRSNMPPVGIAKFTTETAAGGVNSFTLTPAAVVGMSCRCMGAMLITRFEILGGRLT